MSDDEKPELLVIARQHVEQLKEHFDTVQILCSKFDPETEITHVVTPGFGNMLARTRQCDEFVRNENTKDKMRTIGELEKDEEEDDNGPGFS